VLRYVADRPPGRLNLQRQRLRPYCYSTPVLSHAFASRQGIHVLVVRG
jgi:hypothetical protein